MRTKLEVTQEEIYTSNDWQDVQKREQEEGGFLLISVPEVLDVDVESEMDSNAKWTDHRTGVEKVVEVEEAVQSVSRWQWEFKVPTL